MTSYSMQSDFQKISDAYYSIYESSRSGDDVKFKFVDEWDAKRIVSSISRRTDNPRIKVEQFKKYYKDPKKRWFGMFVRGKCMSLCVLKRTPYTESIKDIILLAEIQSIIKGYGKPLIEELLKRYPNIWWSADPKGGKSLVEYYRQFTDMDEFDVEISGWSGTPQTFFLRASDKRRRDKIIDLLKSVECRGKTKKKIEFPEDEIKRLSKVPKGERFYTTRVSDDFHKFKDGDLLSLPWKKNGFVTRVFEFDDLDDHPFKDELTRKEIDFLKDYDKFKVLEIRVIKG